MFFMIKMSYLLIVFLFYHTYLLHFFFYYVNIKKNLITLADCNILYQIPAI